VAKKVLRVAAFSDGFRSRRSLHPQGPSIKMGHFEHGLVGSTKIIVLQNCVRLGHFENYLKAVQRTFLLNS
jgi:hypothetical protein